MFESLPKDASFSIWKINQLEKYRVTTTVNVLQKPTLKNVWVFITEPSSLVVNESYFLGSKANGMHFWNFCIATIFSLTVQS